MHQITLIAIILSFSTACSKSSDSETASSRTLQGTFTGTCQYLGANTFGNAGGQYQKGVFAFDSDAFTFSSMEYSSSNCASSDLNVTTVWSGTTLESGTNIDFTFNKGVITPVNNKSIQYWQAYCKSLTFSSGVATDASACSTVSIRFKTFYNSFKLTDGKTLCFGAGSDYSADPLLGDLTADKRFSNPDCTLSFTKN